MSIESHPRKIKGFAFVTFVMPQNAVEAFAKLDGTSFQVKIGRLSTEIGLIRCSMYTQYEDSGTVTVGRYQNSGAKTGTFDIKF